MRTMRRTMSAFLAVAAIVLSVFSCTSSPSLKNPDVVQMDDIVILHTNDVHCGIEDNIGYAGLAYYKQEMREITPYVGLVDCGDAIQGDSVGTMSKGSYITEIMNRLKYDAAIFGNHEFDYNANELAKRINEADFPYLAANIVYGGAKNKEFYQVGQVDAMGNKLEGGKIRPYIIKQFGNTKVAFIGVATPYSIQSSTPKYFMENTLNGQNLFVFKFYTGATVSSDQNNPLVSGLYERIQRYVDEARNSGAKYVIALCHLGLEDECAPDRAVDLINHTHGIDAVLDGHSHTALVDNDNSNGAFDFVNDQGKKVVYAQTGTKLMNIGRLTIKPNGQIRAYLVEDVKARSIAADAFVQKIKSKYEDKLKEVVGSSDAGALKAARDENGGRRAVRNRETLLGDFCADAYRYCGMADIGFVNGGGIRGDLPNGQITLNNLLKIHPYGNTLTVVKVKGSVIRDALEYATRAVLKDAWSGGNAVGESGGFQQVSGIKFTIDPDANGGKANVTMDDSGFWKGPGSGTYRVQNIKVCKWLRADEESSQAGNWDFGEESSWVDLDLNGDYTLASHNYLLENLGDGFTMFSDAEIKSSGTVIDNQVLIRYMEEKLNGVIKSSDYGNSTPHRITVVGAVTGTDAERI